MLFEWGEIKNQSNQKKHGMTFDNVKSVFTDAFALEIIDNSINYGEERLILIGKINDKFYSVVYTERHDIIRIVSARFATKGEINEYFNYNGH